MSGLWSVIGPVVGPIIFLAIMAAGLPCFIFVLLTTEIYCRVIDPVTPVHSP